MGLSLCKSEESEELDSKDVVKMNTPASSKQVSFVQGNKESAAEDEADDEDPPVLRMGFRREKAFSEAPVVQKKTKKGKNF